MKSAKRNLIQKIFIRLVLLLIVLVITGNCKQSKEVEMPKQEPIIDNFMVGVYYYPWYLNDFHGGHYLRERLVPPQSPQLGEYNDRTSQVVGQHIAWCRAYGIDLWVTSWWGPGGREDVTTLTAILPHPDLGNIKIAAFYETTGRTNEFADFNNVRSDIAYLADKYFGHPNYLRINDRPVLFVYLTRVLSNRGTLADFLEIMRDAASDAGFNIFIVGDEVFGSAPSSAGNIPLLDAITCYDVYGSTGAHVYATQSGVDSYFRQQEQWKQLALRDSVGFVPAISPGFNDKGVRDGHQPLSRKLTENDKFGSMFRAMLQQVKHQVDSKMQNMFMITSWNEWHEDTQIEPTALADSTNRDDSATGSALTTGLYYEGYGTRYLELIREEISGQEN